MRILDFGLRKTEGFAMCDVGFKTKGAGYWIIQLWPALPALVRLPGGMLDNG